MSPKSTIPGFVFILLIACGGGGGAAQQEFPDAVADAFGAIGNVQVNVDAANGLLANDGSFLAGAIAITAFDAVSALGGEVQVAGDGSFSYNPPVGMEGVDTFTYDLSVGGNTATATVTITISDMVWFVDDTAAAGGDGRFTTPFDSLGAFNAVQGGGGAAPEAGDAIFLAAGSGGVYDGGITLLDNQRLFGSGVDLVIGSTTIVSASTASRMTNTLGDGITLANANHIEGLAINGAAQSGIDGANVAGPTTIFSVLIEASASDGISLSGNTTGTFTIGAFNREVVIDAGFVHGIQLSTNSATVMLDSVFIYGVLGDGIQSINTNLTVDGCFLGIDQTAAPRPIGQDGIEVLQLTGPESLTIVNTTLRNIGARGVVFDVRGTATLAADISGTSITNTTGPSFVTRDAGVAGQLVLASDGVDYGPTGAGAKSIEMAGAGLGSTIVTSMTDQFTTSGNGLAGGYLLDRITFDADPLTAGTQTVAGGDWDVGTGVAANQRVAGDGVAFLNPTGALSIGTLDIFNQNGTGLTTDTKGLGTTFNLITGGGSVDTIGGAATFLDPPLHFPPLTVDLTFDLVRSVGSPRYAILIDHVVGRLRIKKTDIRDATGAPVRIRNADKLAMRCDDR